MAQMIILLITLFLLTLLAYLAHRRPPRIGASPVAEDLTDAVTELALRTPRRRLRRLRCPRTTVRLLLTILRSRAPWSTLTLLHEHHRDLTLLLMQLTRDMKHPPRLPADEHAVPRMLLLAREMLRHDSPCDAASLLHALDLWHESAATTFAERVSLPLCLRVAICERLDVTLAELRHDLREAQRGHHLALRLPRLRKPIAKLASTPLTPACIDALLHQLRQSGQTDLLSALEDFLTASGLSAADLTAQHAHSQTLCAESILQCLSALRTLSTLNWQESLEASDPLHTLLLDDPSDIYPQMTPDSRAAYRLRAAALARRFGVEEARLVRSVIRLSQIPEKDGIGDHVGWYLLEVDGVRALHRDLKARRGGMGLWLQRRRSVLRDLFLVLLNTGSGLWLLRAGHSLWLLPPLMMITGCGARFLADLLLDHSAAQPVPQIHLSSVPTDLRTLVVIPAVLRSRTDAVPAVRRLLLAAHAMPQGAVDCMLLADYADSLTASSGDDSTIVYAAVKAIDALNSTQDQRQFFYLQRSRSYDRRLHRYTGRDGLQGALADVRQLIAEGSCPDTFDEATIPPESLRRRYAYVLVLPADATASPDMLLPLMGALEHPLNRRKAVIARPASLPDPDTLRTHLGQLHAHQERSCACLLLDPLALQETVDRLDLPASLPPLLLDAMAGCIRVPESRVYPAMPPALAGCMLQEHRRCEGLWQHLKWLLPWRSAAQGVERNPLERSGRRRLRRTLGNSLLPVVQLFTLLYAALAGDTALLLLTLLLPELSALIPLDRHTPLRLVSRWAMLPLRSFSQADAILRALWLRLSGRELPYAAADALPSLENWSQTLSALALTAASLFTLPPCWAGLALAALFGCFPLVHTHLDRPVSRHETVTEQTESSLSDMAHATWQYFAEVVGEQTHHLPPEGYQVKPWRGASSHMRPDDVGLYLLACMAARELELIPAAEMAERMARAADTLEKLPLWHGMPYAHYDLANLEPTAPYVDTQRSGIFCACLLCAAQGLRAVLPDIPREHRTLPARLDALASAMELHRLYDPAARLLHTGMHTDTEIPGDGHHHLFASPALLASFTAVMLGQLPFDHLRALDRICVRAGRSISLCSPEGSASDYLLPLLLLPLTPGTAMSRTVDAFLHAQRRHSIQGMYGLSECAVWQFDGQMNYLRRSMGLSRFALRPVSTGRVAAPYAAALGLPFGLLAAHDSLVRMRSHGIMGRLGFFDALDMDPARLPEGTEAEHVQCHLSGHQAMLLCALCNALTGGHLPRTFMAIPAAAACALLLRTPVSRGLILPATPVRSEHVSPREPSFRRDGHADRLPIDAHVIGSPEASLTLSASGCGVMRARGVNITHFTADPAAMEGLQFYLGDGLQFHRLGEGQHGECVMAEGSIRLSGRFSGLQYTLSAMADSASGTFLHTLEIINMTGSERFIEAADCLLPGFAAEDFTLRAARPSDRVLTLTYPVPGAQPQTLCHVLTTADPLIALSAHTEQHAFLGGGSLRMPSSLSAPLDDGFTSSPVSACAAFRVKLSLGVRGRTTLVFTTRFLRPGEAFSLDSLTPRATDLPGLLTLSRLACRAVYDALGMNQARAAAVSRAAGVMLWQGQPHQGPVAPLTFGQDVLHTLHFHPSVPLMTFLLYTAAGLPLLAEAADAAGWLTLSGQPVQLCVLCMGAESDAARTAAEASLAASPARTQIHFLRAAELPDGYRETVEAASRLLLYEGAGTLSDQLDALTLRMPEPPPAASPTPVPLPAETLRFSCESGGWQEQTDDYVQHLTPGEPQRDLSLYTPEEHIWLEREDSCFAPFGNALARRIQFSPSQTQWHSASTDLDMTLTAAQLPGESWRIRTLRLKNQTSREMHLTLTIAADFGDLSCLSPLPGGMAALHPDTQGMRCLVMSEGDVQPRRMSRALLACERTPAALNAPEEDTGSIAVLSLPLRLSASGSAAASWLSGDVSSADALEQLLNSIRASGSSLLFRQARQHWAQWLALLTVSTPDPALNLLMNRLLPVQARLPRSDGNTGFTMTLMNARSLAVTEPTSARDALLVCAAYQYQEGDVQSRWRPGSSVRTGFTGDRLLLPIAIADYIALTGDSSVLHEPAPYVDGPAESLHAHCMRALTSIRLGRLGLPLSGPGELDDTLPLLHGESVWLGLIFAHALHVYAPLAPDDDRTDILEVHRHLLAAIERSGWDGSWYLRGYTAAGQPAGSANAAAYRLDSVSQSWAALALGVNQRTVQAVESAWQALWNPKTGTLLRLGPPFDALQDAEAPTAQLPFFGSNGGQDTLSAVWLMEALCICGEYDRAWLLVRALNPALHADRNTPPWLLPGTLTADGVALTPDENGASGLLYSVILRHLLGFFLQGETLRLSPHVPRDWDFFSLTLLKGASTWHFHMSRDEGVLTLDGDEVPGGIIRLADDGRIHQVRVPLA